MDQKILNRQLAQYSFKPLETEVMGRFRIKRSTTETSMRSLNSPIKRGKNPLQGVHAFYILNQLSLELFTCRPLSITVHPHRLSLFDLRPDSGYLPNLHSGRNCCYLSTIIW